MSWLYNTLMYEPLYNGLIFLMDIGADAGVAVVVLTLIVRFILFPLSRKAVITQQNVKRFQPEIDAIKEKYKKDRQEQARKILELYKEKGINPFSSFFLILIQLPIIFALYRIFWASGLPEIKQNILYSFVPVPESVNMVFIGIFDIASKSWVLAVLVGITTFVQMKLSMPALKGAKPIGQSFKDDLARSMNIQMRYFFPVISIFISYTLSGAIALYWLTSNLFTIGQEIVIKRTNKIKSEKNGNEQKQ